MMRLAFKIVQLFVVILLMAAAWLWHFIGTPLIIEQTPHTFIVKPGSTIRVVSGQLVEEKVLTDPWFFMIMARLTGRAAALKAGSYEFKSGITPYQLFNKITSGNVTQISITFIEGWTFSQIRKQLDRREGIRHLSTGLKESEILQRINASEQHPEGLFFPDTYFFVDGISDLDILKRSYQAMQQKLGLAWQQRKPDLPYSSAYEALIMASIIEKETGRAEERPMIARVFLERLKIGMRLQTDPSVIYGMGDKFDGNLRKADLLKDTPYNTYVRAGLPPTPIANPGLGAIEAALNPGPRQGYLYFVGKGDGGHAFSKTLAEHNRAVAKYQLKR